MENIIRRWNELKIENATKYRQKTTHKRNPNGYLPVFCRIFDFQFHSIFLTAWWMLL